MAKIADGRSMVKHVKSRRHVKGVWALSAESCDKGVKTRLMKHDESPPDRLALRRFSWEAEA